MLGMLLYFLASFGLAFVLGASKISLPFRQLLAGVQGGDLTRMTQVQRTDQLSAELVKPIPPLIPYVGPFLVALVECPGCLGFWIGALTGWIAPVFIIYNVAGLGLLTDSTFGIGVLLGLATAASNMLLGKFVGIVE